MRNAGWFLYVQLERWWYTATHTYTHTHTHTQTHTYIRTYYIKHRLEKVQTRCYSVRFPSADLRRPVKKARKWKKKPAVDSQRRQQLSTLDRGFVVGDRGPREKKKRKKEKKKRKNTFLRSFVRFLKSFQRFLINALSPFFAWTRSRVRGAPGERKEEEEEEEEGEEKLRPSKKRVDALSG